MDNMNNMENMDMEQDLVVFEDDKGQQITMEVMDYMFYEGKEYAVLASMDEVEGENGEAVREAYVMEVVPVGEDMEEFVPVDEDLAEKLIDIIENSDFGEDEFEDEE